jgi:hypothetical protein
MLTCVKAFRRYHPVWGDDDEGAGEKKVWQIVGEPEADANKG